MPIKKQANLSRFKSSEQGLIEFATLIEQADPTHRDMILQSAMEQDPRFAATALKKVVFFEEFVFLDEGILAEILSKVSAKILCYAMMEMTEDFKKQIVKNLGHRETKMLKEEEEKMGGKPTSSFVLGAQRQILKIARALEAQGTFVFELAECPRFENKSRLPMKKAG